MSGAVSRCVRPRLSYEQGAAPVDAEGTLSELRLEEKRLKLQLIKTTEAYRRMSRFRIEMVHSTYDTTHTLVSREGLRRCDDRTVYIRMLI